MIKKIFNFGLLFLAVSFWGNLQTNVVFAIDEIPAEQIIVENVDVVPIPTATFIIRNGDAELYRNSIPLPNPDTTIQINDINNASHDINSRSVLGILKTIDDVSDSFSISNLQYYAPGIFGPAEAFYLKCMSPNGSEELCDNWQYAVGGSTPFSSIDTTILSGGETVGIYFGTSHHLILNTNTIISGESLNATAEKYDYENNLWNPLTEVSVGVTLPNPENPWSPIVVSTHPVDALGNAIISIMGENTYTLGIAEDFYFPSYTVTVTPTPPSGGNNGGGGGNVPPAPTFSATDAINYLKSVQGANGSFGDSDLYTDWAAIAYGSGNVSGSYRDSLLEYFSSHNSISSLITDNERRTIALLSLGKNPYSWNDVNYIEAIVDDFDGTQFGDENLINDDIFALIPLGNAGYTENDEIIAKTVAFIISKQQADGSWEESVDITAAAIQALKSFDLISGVSNALTNAGNYLANTQGGDGGWGNISSTSWVMQAENTLNASWTKNGKSGLDYLAIMQTNADNDGAILPLSETSQNIIWATSYAIPAGLGKPWSEIMDHVSKPKNKDNSSGTSRNTDKHKDNETETEETTLQNSKIEPLTIAPVIEEKIDQITKNKKLPIPPKEDSPLNTEKKEEIIPPIFTATAINALPPQTSGILQNIPIILGTLSGIILLYAVLKFFAIF
jgi:hypothetical protein